MKTPARPTPYPDLNAALRALVDGVREVLGGRFVGAYLQGSFAVGDFDEYSDCDFVVVVNDDLPDDVVDTLQGVHGRVYDLDNPWAQHLEGSYFPAAVLKDASTSGLPLWYLDHGSRSLIHHNHCNTRVVRWVVREHGVTLAGPPPETLVDPIPADTLRGEMMAVLHDWGREILAAPDRYKNRFYQGFIVLSYCRILHDLLNGTVGSKQAGAAWAKTHLDAAWVGLIDRAWACRPDPAAAVRQPADSADFQATLAFVRYVIAEASARWPGAGPDNRRP